MIRDDGRAFADGELLRGVTVQDELLQARLGKESPGSLRGLFRHVGRERDMSAVLVDVEHLFDGQGLFFYFLGDVTPEV